MIDRQNKSPLLCLLIFLISSQSVLATEIKATLDRNPISINESVQLTFSATESPDDDPDFSVLEKDFEILNQSQRSNSSWVNGKSSKTIQWILNVIPKRVGNLIIPAVAFGRDTSQTVLLKVQQNQSTNSRQDTDLYIEVEATPKDPYVQAQVLYTLRLYSKVNLSQARLSELEIEDALVEKLGEVKKYNSNRNGVEYTVNELNYAVFPQKSGELNIAPMVLTAEVVTSSRQRFNGFFNRQSSITKRVLSNAITLNVKAVPESFKGKHWIPASQMVIEEKWSGDIQKMKVGEPLTRTLTLLTIGNTVAQLPEIQPQAEIAGLKTYPDQPVLKEQKRTEGLIAFREEKVAYIPSKAGSYTIPAIEIPWFNTETQTMEVARIAEKTVKAAANLATQTGNAKSVAPDPIVLADDDYKKSAPMVVKTVENPFWMWLSIILATGWLVTILYLLIKRKPKQVEIVDNSKEVKLKETVKALKKACADNNALAAKNALLAWGKQVYGSETIAAIAPHCEARLRDEIYLLNQFLYADQAEPWEGKKLFQAFTENKARKSVGKNINDGLEPLFKL